MSRIETALASIEREMAKGSRKDPAKNLLSLLDQMTPDEVRRWQVDLRAVTDQFMPTLKRSLEERIGQRLLGGVDSVSAKGSQASAATISTDTIDRLWTARLASLSSKHIFQWSTHYRDTLAELVDLSLGSALHISEGSVAAVRRAVSQHTYDIFTKGYAYVTTGRHETHHEAVTKSIGGLDRFLDVALEPFSIRMGSARGTTHRRSLFALSSAVLSGVLEGYSSVTFGREDGSMILPRYPRTWGHYLAFVTRDHLVDLAAGLAEGEVRSGIEDVVIPWADVATRAIEDSRGFYPTVGQFFREDRRLDITLRLADDESDNPTLQVSLFLNEDYASQNALRDAAARGAHVIIARPKADVRVALSGQRTIPTALVLLRAESSTEKSVDISGTMSAVIQERLSPRARSRPLTHNIARGFPLRDPFKSKFYHVPRLSVRALLNTYERSNGVRLWCSVRRSGKTTACFDLGTTSSAATVISQTCDSTEQAEGSHVFYDAVCGAIESGRQLAPDFVTSSFRSCVPLEANSRDRMIVVLDEYETLFGRLRASAHSDPGSRFTVIQPLLNQLVAFSRDNLLVLLGQQPGAHYILMDQNQLSAYVEQDPFPLFQHHEGSATGEFCALLRKIFASRVEFDAGFADALFTMTAGHPYLTVNAVVELVEWLIHDKRPASELKLRQIDVTRFRKEWLTSHRLAQSAEFDFFRSAASNALGPFSRTHTPWLFSVYSVLREIGQQGGVDASISTRRYKQLFESASGNALPVNSDDLLRTAAQSNFFALEGGAVKARIPLLSLIAANAHPDML